jgi:hypothetical protein
MSDGPRVLFLLCPGVQARMYLIGLIHGAKARGIPHGVVELGPLWDHMAQTADKAAAAREIEHELTRLIRAERFTHALGYGYNGVELGRLHSPTSTCRPLLPDLGVRHIMLWTDHPNWMSRGIALHPVMRRVLSDPGHSHFLKSHAAAAEARRVLAWPNVHEVAMGEAYDLLPPVEAPEPLYDAIVISGSIHPVPATAAAWLAEDDPNPAEIDAAMSEEVEARVLRIPGWEDSRGAIRAILAEKRRRPDHAIASHAMEQTGPVRPEIDRLMADPARWYAGLAELQRLSGWRRDFWIAWLARRTRVAVLGGDASCLGIEQEASHREWVPYADQPRAYALGACAVTINAGHDEEGCTHKPFQIAASGVACVHHATRGLEDQFESGREVGVFWSGAWPATGLGGGTWGPR